MALENSIKAIAWDFDGVLNRNVVDGNFVWHLNLEEDLGIAPDTLEQGIFTDMFMQVIRGKTDLLDHVQAWLDTSAYDISAEKLLEYWFRKDDLKDPITTSLLDRLSAQGITQVIATNNEHRRSTYIETTAGFGEKIDQLFSSGRIGHAKPDVAFFEHVSCSLGLEPCAILLIDDSVRNIETARSLGWHGFHFTDSSRSELAAYLGF